MKESNKKDAAIEWTYKKVFLKHTKVTERPVLSEDTLRRMSQLGLNPDEMSNEQLAAFEEMENIEKRSWFSKIFSYGSIIFALGAIINLFTLNIEGFIFSGAVSLVLMYIGYRIQLRISSKKFYRASILKWLQDQKKKKYK